MNTAATQRLSPAAVRALVVLWPAFLMAGVMEMAVFAFVDPAQLRGPTQLSAQAVYTLGFLGFWMVIATACALTRLLGRSAEQVNAADDPL